MYTGLLLPTLLVPPVYFYHQYLAGLYPTLPVSQNLELDDHTEGSNPAVGFMRSNRGWIQTHAADMWTAELPMLLLEDRESKGNDQKSTSKSMVVKFTGTFWYAWPLKLERFIFTSLLRIGIGSFELRGSDEGVETFDVGAKVLGGLFAVEAHNYSRYLSMKDDSGASFFEGPIITSWWIKSSDFVQTKDTTSPEVIGGYHSFTVEVLPAPIEGERMVRLIFVAHLILSTSIYPNPLRTASPPSRDIPNLSIVQRTIMYFHTFYARILLDCAVRNLKARR